MKKLTFLALMFFLLTACTSTTKVDLSGTWKLVSYGDKANPTAAVPDADTSFKFENGQLSGNAGCNNFGGKYELKGDKIVFSQIMSTMMYCDKTSPQEQAVLAVFGDGVSLSLQANGNNLTITSADGKSVVNLARK